MGHPGYTPEVQEGIHAGELRDSDAAGFPTGIELSSRVLGPIVKVANIMDRDEIAVHLGPRFPGDIGQPVPLVAWLEENPPESNQRSQHDSNYGGPSLDPCPQHE